MKKKQKQKPIAATVAWKVCVILVLMCTTLSLAMQNAFYRELSIAETKYMTEVISHITLKINSELNHYIDMGQSLAKSQSVKDYLDNIEAGNYATAEEIIVVPEMAPPVEEFSDETEDSIPNMDEDTFPDMEEDIFPEDLSDLGEEATPLSTDIPSPTGDTVETVTASSMVSNTLSNQTNFTQYQGYDTALAEIKNIASLLGNSVIFVAICSIQEDNFFNNQEYTGDESFSLASRPFYAAYTTQKTYITEPYVETITGTDIISIAEPVYGDNGHITGIVLIQLSLTGLSNIVTNASFGDTGASMLMDRNNNVIAYSDTSIVGMNISQLSYSGEFAEQELANPTGTIINYNFAGSDRTGGIVTISELSGWKMILAMSESEFKENISVVTARLNLGLVLAVIICSSLCAKNIYFHLAPMSKLENFMEELAEGNLSATLDCDEPNEIGRLAQHMNRTAKSLASYIDMIDRAMEGLSQGNLNRPDRINFKGDFIRIERSIEKFTFILSDSLQEIKNSMEQMNQGAEQVASGAQLLSNGSAEQSQSVEGLHHLIDSINKTIVVTAQNSSSVTSDAKMISDNLVLSNEKMQELVVSVQDIRSMSDEVKRIIKTIEEVAFQTNILSLNASVEAARAGSSGKGFAVVADEVRNLSIKTAEAADETNKIINDIATAIETGTELAQTTSRDLQHVVDDVDLFVENISSISLSAQGQADAIQEINQGINEISQVVVQNSAISEESAASSEELSAQSDQMLGLVQQYQLLNTVKK